MSLFDVILHSRGSNPPRQNHEKGIFANVATRNDDGLPSVLF